MACTEQDNDLSCISVVVDIEGLEAGADSGTDLLCGVCYLFKPEKDFTQFSNCGHAFCEACVRKAFENWIRESRVDVQCLQCAECVTQHEIKQILDVEYFEMYLSFTLRKFLATQQPDVCYCLAPNCPYACINSCQNIPQNYIERNRFVCGREECRSEYCNKCKKPWHPEKTCEEFEKEYSDGSVGITEELRASMGAKNCPTCNVIIEKASDGSCNQVVCAVCRTSFCWLCGKRVSEMHYMSPTGCPLYGTKMWTRRKRWCCRLWLWILAPMIIILLSLVVVPIILIAFPLGVGYKVYSSQSQCHKVCRVMLTIIVVMVCMLTSPFVALLASIAIYPLMIIYFYCFIPIHTCMQS